MSKKSSLTLTEMTISVTLRRQNRPFWHIHAWLVRLSGSFKCVNVRQFLPSEWESKNTHARISLNIKTL